MLTLPAKSHIQRVWDPTHSLLNAVLLLLFIADLNAERPGLADMGYRNPELPNALNLFASAAESITWSNERLHQRLREGSGLPLYRADQLEVAYDDLVNEPLLRLEYDRFLPEVPRRAAD